MVRFVPFYVVAVVGPHLEVGLDGRTGVVEIDYRCVGNAVDGDR